MVLFTVRLLNNAEEKIMEQKNKELMFYALI